MGKTTEQTGMMNFSILILKLVVVISSEQFVMKSSLVVLGTAHGVGMPKYVGE